MVLSIAAFRQSLERWTSFQGFSAKKLRFTLVSIHLPLLKSSLMTASLIVFVEVMKELPATLILRPFGIDTLATYFYQYASSEKLAQASPAA